MKCPKCNYLGFETGDRCRNCGYDFSLVVTAPGRSLAEPASNPLSEPLADRATPAFDRVSSDAAVDRLGDMPLQSAGRDAESPDTMRQPRVAVPHPDTLPLFTGATLDDEPLVRFPAPPRVPVSVRRTPEASRFRPPVVLTRREEPDPEPSLGLEDATPPAPVPARRARAVVPAMTVAMEPCSSGARMAAVGMDLMLLVGIDTVVLYFTLRMAALTLGEWRLLPPVPIILFLLLLKITYWFAFTAIGGQTIGKMAARIRVVSDDGPVVAPALAFRRTLAAIAAVVTLGGTFLPALVSREGRAVHDRMARTRVVALPVA